MRALALSPIMPQAVWDLQLSGAAAQPRRYREVAPCRGAPHPPQRLGVGFHDWERLTPGHRFLNPAEVSPRPHHESCAEECGFGRHRVNELAATSRAPPLHTPSDNGREFTYHETIARAMGVRFFFCPSFCVMGARV